MVNYFIKRIDVAIVNASIELGKVFKGFDIQRIVLSQSFWCFINWRWLLRELSANPDIPGRGAS